MMPTQAVAQNHCGGHGTGWLNGAYPGISDGIVSRQVCFNIGKVIHPKYYKHFKESAQESHLGRYKMGWFLADRLAHQVNPEI